MKGCDVRDVGGIGSAKYAGGQMACFGPGAAWILVALALSPSAVSAQIKSPIFGRAEENGKEPTKMELDVRDAGVDCTFTKDSSAALNSLAAASGTNGRAMTFPWLPREAGKYLVP